MNTLEFMDRIKDIHEGEDQIYTDKRIQYLEDLNVVYGDPDKNIMISMEEMAELTKEISKCGRSEEPIERSYTKWFDLLQEMADVSIILMYLQARFHVTNEDMRMARTVKVKKLEKWLREGGHLDNEKEQ